MAAQKRSGGLTKEEQRVVKALLEKKWRNQDIQALINTGRNATVNSARITGVKKDGSQKCASEDEVTQFIDKKRAFDAKTGLNAYDDERLVRAREAMILAVQIFNSAALNFKTEVFIVLANIAWTYLLHEYYHRKGVAVLQADGRALVIGQMIKREDCPLTEGMKNNLKALKTIRDDVEHKLLGRSDPKWFGLFQACCLNFDKILCGLYGSRLSLANQLGFAIQFSRMGIEQAAPLNNYALPDHIKATDAKLERDVTEEQRADTEYEMRVVYTLVQGTKGRSHFEFLRPESAEGKAVHNVLIQHQAADHLYPHKPSIAAQLVSKQSGKKFTDHNHTQAWRLYNVRPRNGAKQPATTNKEFCIYHPAHRDYTYSDKWVEKLVAEISDDTKFAALRAVKL